MSRNEGNSNDVFLIEHVFCHTEGVNLNFYRPKESSVNEFLFHSSTHSLPHDFLVHLEMGWDEFDLRCLHGSHDDLVKTLKTQEE